jgi:hypothetical protein
MSTAAEWSARLRGQPVVVIETYRTKPDRPGRGRRRFSTGPLTVLGIAEDRGFGGLGRAVQAYRSRSERSAARRRDGAVRDFTKNAARAQEKFVVEVSKVPRDLTRSRTYRKIEKATCRPVVNMLRW